MNEFHTVFQIAPGTGDIEAEITIRLIIGFIVLAYAVSAIVLFVHRRDSAQWRPKPSKVIFLLIWSVIWLGFTIPWFFGAKHERQKLFATYQDGRYEVVEGPVRVIRTQPKSGHAPGDLVLISNKFFEINYFVSTHAYHQSIAHGGYLHNGVVARVFYVDTNILRIDILNAEFPLWGLLTVAAWQCRIN